MTVVINGTTGVTSVNGSAAAPSVTGTDTDTGIVYGTNTLSLATGGTAAMTIDSSQNTGFGTATPNARVEIAQSISGGNGVGLILNDFGSSGGSEGLHIQWRSGTDKQSDQCRIGQISNATGSGSNLVFYTNGADTGTATERARFNSTGAFVLAGGTTTANGVGITFPATQSASTNANTLDDYEEGAWTPSIYAGGANLISSYNGDRYGTYTKIGNMVYFEARFSNVTANAQTGSLTIAGLPFACGSYFFPIYNWPYSGLSSTGTVILRTNTGGTVLQVQTTNTSGSGADLTQSNLSGGSLNWMIAGFYQID